MSDDELAKQLPNLISKLNSNGNDNNKGSGSSSSGNSSQKSGQGSPKTQESSNIQGEKDKKLISEVRDANSDTTFRLKLGGFTSGRSSRKGSSCSTPVGSSLRTEMDYPSPNFIRPNLSQCPGVSVDENSKLTIRLHYNPVMDEWLSLTEEVVNPRARDDSDVIFDLLKEETTDNNDELIKVAQFFQVQFFNFGIFQQFLSNKTDISGNTVDRRNWTIFGIFNELWSPQNVNVARFARNVELE